MLPTRTQFLQLAALAGLAFAFAGPTAERPAFAQAPDCPDDDACSFKKPVVVFLVDYSTSMNAVYGDPMDDLTRWDAAVATIQNLVSQNQGFLSDYTLLGLVRFGHDPDPNNPGTPIPGDASGLVDGQAVDVLWYDPDDPNGPYTECSGDPIISALADTPAPLDGQLDGIEAWTNGALLRARSLMETGYVAHPQDAPSMDDRGYLQIVITDGEWRDPDGQSQSAQHDPAPTAAALWNAGIDNGVETIPVPTYVLYVGDQGGADEDDANALAAAGGTGQAWPAADLGELLVGLQNVVEDIKGDLFTPGCASGTPRVMFLLDASSSMLNAGGGTMPANEDESGWDLARYALAGDPYNTNTHVFEAKALDAMMQPTEARLEDVFQFGIAVFGHDTPAPGEQKLLVQYGKCQSQNFYWAMSPQVSHPNCGPYDYAILDQSPDTPINEIVWGGGDCPDPWSGSPIDWVFPSVIGGSPGPLDDPSGPGFEADTRAHMPRCDMPPNMNTCSGSGTYTHLGLELLEANHATYHAQQVADGLADGGTRYVNVLITDGLYNGYSTDAEVEAPLVSMHQKGITTYVIGLGDGVNGPQAQAQLAQMANWGSGDALDHYDADNQQQLEMALAAIVGQVPHDPCCASLECNPPPPMGCLGCEPDPPEDICEDDDDCAPGLYCEKPDPNAPFGVCIPLPTCVDEECKAIQGPLFGCSEDDECVLQPCDSDEVCQDQYPDGDPPFVCDEDGVCVSHPCVPEMCPEGLVCGENGECVEPDTTTGSTSTGGSTGESDTTGDASTGAGPTSGDTSGDTTGDDSETTAVELDPPGGCGCTGTNRGSPRGLLALLPLLATRRRRKHR